MVSSRYKYNHLYVHIYKNMILYNVVHCLEPNRKLMEMNRKKEWWWSWKPVHEGSLLGNSNVWQDWKSAGK